MSAAARTRRAQTSRRSGSSARRAPRQDQLFDSLAVVAEGEEGELGSRLIVFLGSVRKLLLPGLVMLVPFAGAPLGTVLPIGRHRRRRRREFGRSGSAGSLERGNGRSEKQWAVPAAIGAGGLQRTPPRWAAKSPKEPQKIEGSARRGLNSLVIKGDKARDRAPDRFARRSGTIKAAHGAGCPGVFPLGTHASDRA